MFCRSCGKELEDGTAYCPNCGTKQFDEPGSNNQQMNPSQPTGNYYNPAPVVDAPSGGFMALCFFFPVVGLILYLVWKDTLPMRAHSCGKGALIGVIVWFALGIVMGIISGIIAAAMVNNGGGYYFY